MQLRRSTAVASGVSAVLLGCAAAVGVPVWWSARGTNVDAAAVNPGAAIRLAERPARPAPAPAASSSPSGSSNASAGSPRRPAPHKSSPPVALRIASVDISAPIVPVGVDARGAVAVPKVVDTVGWYRWGAAPTSTSGSTVLVGHVDSAEQGEGTFFTLYEVRAGARVTVTTADRQVHRYRVVSRQSFPKSNVPLADLFSVTGTPRLTLITCGGAFDRSTHSYRDNVVVTAVPADE